MNGKLLGGSLLTGAGLLAAVVDAWARHFFFAAFHVARAESLESAGSFDPGPYGNSPETAGAFIGVRVLIWVVVAAGLALVARGTWEAW